MDPESRSVQHKAVDSILYSFVEIPALPFHHLQTKVQLTQMAFLATTPGVTKLLQGNNGLELSYATA